MDVRSPRQPCYVFGHFRLDAARLTLSRDGRLISATPRVFSTLLYLVENAGRLVSKDEMLRALWPGRIAEEANLTQAIFDVRKILANSTDAKMIVTVPGLGYRFTPEVRVEAAPAQIEAVALAPLHPAAGPRPKRAHLLLWAAGVVAIGAAALGVWRLGDGAARLPSGRTGVVLADLQNFTGDRAFDHVIPRILQVDFAQSPFLQLMSEAKTAETLGLMELPKDAALTPALAQKVCARDNGGAAITPTIANLGRRYVLTLTASDCLTGKPLYDDKQDVAGKEGVPHALDVLASRMRRRLGEEQASIARFDVTLAPERTASFAALQAYSEAGALVKLGKNTDAIPLYRRAIDLDPNFVMAYLSLSRAYYNTRQPLEDVATITKAYQMRDQVSEPNQFLISSRYNTVVTKDLNAALTDIKLAAEIYPKDASAWANLSNLQNWLGDYGDAVASGDRALALDPGSMGPYSVLARALNHDNQTARAEQIDDMAIRRGIAGPDTRGQLIAEHFLLGDEAGAERLIAAATGTPLEREALLEGSDIAFAKGRVRNAMNLLSRADMLGRPDGLTVDYSNEAADLAVVGLSDRAREALRQVPADKHTGYYYYVAALLDDPAKVEADLSRDLALWPHDTLLQGQFAPQTRAALLMRNDQPAAAAREVEKVGPFMFRDLDAPYLKASALLAAGDAHGAAAAFRAVLDHPGLGDDALFFLARLGLARALRLSGEVAASRTEYQAFLTAWKDADPDLPPVRQAKAEYSELTASCCRR